MKKVLVPCMVIIMVLFLSNIVSAAPKTKVSEQPKIVSIANISSTTYQNSTFDLPAKVKALLSNKKYTDVAVSWGVNYIDTGKPGTYNYYGTVKGYSKKVIFILTVKEVPKPVTIKNIDDINATVGLNDNYMLPHIVKAEMSDGTINEYAVQWNINEKVDTSKLGTFTYTGKVGDNDSVKVTVNVLSTGEIILDQIKKYQKNPDYNDEKSLTRFGTLSKDTPKVRELAKQVNDNRDISTLTEIFKMVLSVPDADFYGDGSRFWDVDKVIEKGKRSCDDYATLFGAITREKGIPTAEVTAYDMSAMYYNNSNYKKGFWSGNYSGHEFLEVKLSDGKWYLVDSTRGYVYLDYDYNNFSLPEGYMAFSKETDQGDFVTDKFMSGIIQNFINFDVSSYKEPSYKYVDLRDNLTKSLEPYKMQIMIGRDPILIKGSELSRNTLNNLLYNKLFTAGNITEGYDSDISKRSDLNEHHLVYLYTYGKPVPEELKRIFPQISTMKPGDVNYYVDYTRKDIGPVVRLLIVGNESGDKSFDDIIQSLDPKKVYGN